MKRRIFVVLGVLLVLAGAVWTLQGLDVFGGTGGMNGQKIWAVIGPIVAVVGLVLAIVGARRPSTAAPDPDPSHDRTTV